MPGETSSTFFFYRSQLFEAFDRLGGDGSVEGFEVCCEVVVFDSVPVGFADPTARALRPPVLPAEALSVSADQLLFDGTEHGPDEELRLQFEATSRLPPHEKDLVREVVENIIIRHDASCRG